MFELVNKQLCNVKNNGVKILSPSSFQRMHISFNVIGFFLAEQLPKGKIVKHKGWPFCIASKSSNIFIGETVK